MFRIGHRRIFKFVILAAGKFRTMVGALYNNFINFKN
jgi:hypothetical protein